MDAAVPSDTIDHPADRVSEHRALAVGLVLTITTIAFENLGVATAMPVVSRDLHGIALYGWVFTATLLASLIGIAVAGRVVDRRGPGMPFAVGLVLFGTGLSLAGLAPTMPVLVAARFVQGLGTGAIPPVAYAAIGRAFTDRARARMFALLSSAWVLPGVIGPAIAGAVAEHLGWRYVFLGIVPLVPLGAILSLPPLIALGPPALQPIGDDRGRVVNAALLALGAGLAIGGLSAPSLAAPFLFVAGALVAARPLRALLPAGTLRARRGVPAAIATRGLQTFAFFGAEAFVPLALTRERGLSPAVAGLVLTFATLAWTAGAWLQDRVGHVRGRGVLVFRGDALVALAIAILTTVLMPSVPVAVPMLAWAIAGLGMGLAYSGLSLIVLAEAPPGREGELTSSLQLSDVLGMALGTGFGGAAVAIASRSGAAAAPNGGIAFTFALCLVAAVLCVGASRRLPRDVPSPVLL